MSRPSSESPRGRLGGTEIVGVVAVNSVDYVSTVLDLMDRGVAVAGLADPDDVVRMKLDFVSRVVHPKSGGGWLRRRFTSRETDELAMVAFTSGTTGGPKGVLLTHANLHDTVSRLTDVMRIDAGIREYLGTPVYHAFGFGRCRTVLWHGGSVFVPDAGFNPAEIARMLARGEINALSMVPTLARVLLASRQLFAGDAHRMRWVEIGSQYMSRAEKEAIRELFPDAVIVHQYGLTEASRSTILVVSEQRGDSLESVGRPVGRTEVRIDESGCVAIRGPHVARTLLVEGRETPATDDDGWFHTSDHGDLVDGFLYYRGRADDVINCGGHKISPDFLEHELRLRLGVEGGIAVARVPDAARGEGVLVAVDDACRSEERRVEEVAAAILRETGVNIGPSLHVLRLSGFPMTKSGKVKRRALTEIFAERVESFSRAAGTVEAAREEPAAIRDVFVRAFPGKDVRSADSFVALGGDSLTFVAVSVALESLLGSLPANWEVRSLAELEGLERGDHAERRWHLVDTTLLVRFVGIVAVVLGHFTALEVGGATYLLLIVAGLNFARFQVPHVLAGSTVLPVLATAGKIAAPLFLLIAATQARHGSIELENLLLLGNWEPALTQQTDLWFLELMVQIMLLMAVLLAWPGVRRSIQRAPWVVPGSLLAVSLASALLGPFVSSTELLYDRVPHMMLWMFALGWVLQLATTRKQKFAVTALATIVPLIVWDITSPPMWVSHAHLWIAAGCGTMVFFDRLPVPYPVDRFAFWIGGASMFIYLLHYSATNSFHKLTGISGPACDVVVGIAAGVLGWAVWELFTRWLLVSLRRRGITSAGFKSGSTMEERR